MGLLFEWDLGKAETNWKKHKVTFDEARTVLSDPDELTLCDDDHSEDEDRYISMGLSSH